MPVSPPGVVLLPESPPGVVLLPESPPGVVLLPEFPPEGLLGSSFFGLSGADVTLPILVIFNFSSVVPILFVALA